MAGKTGPSTTATLTFVKRGSWPESEKPYCLLFSPENGLPSTNHEFEEIHNIPVYDIRNLSSGEPSLERQGFMVALLESKLSYEDFWDEEKLRTCYAEELRSLLCPLLGARSVYIHECVIRRRTPNSPAENGGYGQPIPVIHTDYTLDYVRSLIKQLVGDRAEDLLKSRFQMINVWKPLRGPCRDWPLALCDLQSLDRKDLTQLDEVHPEKVLESQLLLHHDQQKWFYLSDQSPNELLIFKSVDSKGDWGVPHAAFSDPKYLNAAPRESIEFRVLVI